MEPKLYMKGEGDQVLLLLTEDKFVDWSLQSTGPRLDPDLYAFPDAAGRMLSVWLCVQTKICCLYGCFHYDKMMDDTVGGSSPIAAMYIA